VQDKILHLFGRAALLRRPRIQGRATCLPHAWQICPAGKVKSFVLRPGLSASEVELTQNNSK
jgi:hypothetical protein